MEHVARIYLAVRDGCLEKLTDLLPIVTQGLIDRIDSDKKSASVLLSRERDPYRYSGAPVRAYDATIELKADCPRADELLAEAVQGLNESLATTIHTDLSAAIVGENRVFIPCEPTAIRYQYLMRRRADLTHEEFARHYAEIHSEFGVKTGGITGYTQFHADPSLSKMASSKAGFGVWAVDSVAEFYIDSLEDFISATKDNEVSALAASDEENFVDRPNSVMFCSDEILRIG